ncbi:MAG: SpoIIE family protein phosphatase [Bacteroidetes bacterium]|nr:SpoIIE family protein phosphatase [Bacteroidota bacterium]
MKIRFTIGKKIGTGFGVLIFLTMVIFILTLLTLNESRRINDEITKIYNPSVDLLEDLNLLVVRSKMLINNWVFIQRSDDHEEKKQLRQLVDTLYAEKRKELEAIAKVWKKDEKERLKEIFIEVDNLFLMYTDIMGKLISFQSYEDAMIVFWVRPMVEGGEVDMQCNKILKNLGELIAIQQKNTYSVSDKMIEAFNNLQFVVRNLGIALLIGSIIIAVLTVRTIVKPVQEVKGMLLRLGKGIIPEKRVQKSTDEIGDMSEALNQLIDGFKRTTGFAHEVGSGNFESVYQPLSEFDTLGHALLKMRHELHETEKILEQKVIERTEEVVRQKEEIQRKNEEIFASIRYAKRIQEAILPPEDMVNRLVPNSFIFYRPKDIVSGDFFWVEKKEGKVFFAAVDCTGHGVPGAFMSIVGHDMLQESLARLPDPTPAVLLDELNKGVCNTLHTTFDEHHVKDGMDVALCSIDFATKILQFAGAYNPLYLVRGIDVNTYEADRFPIGGDLYNPNRHFTNITIQLEENDTIYVFSDGYEDQFGGKKGKKFMAKRFRNMLLDINYLPMHRQREYIEKNFESWKGHHEQTDDICVIGVRI